MNEHCLQILGGLSLTVVREAAAVFVDGWVEKEEVDQGAFLFRFAEIEGGVAITSRMRHPKSIYPMPELLTPMYNLVAGFWEAGCDVVASGAWPEKLPGQGRLIQPGERPQLALRPIFQHQLPPEERSVSLAPADIEAMVRDLATYRGFREERRVGGRRYLRHATGIQVEALKGRVHRIGERRPSSTGRMLDYFGRGVLPARSWGEVWMGYWVTRGCGRPEAVHVFPEEVALVHDFMVTRYRVEDRSTLNDFAALNFGSGVPLLYGVEAWLTFARNCGDRGDYAMALRCCQQGQLTAANEVERARVEQDAARWREWQAYAANPPAPVEAGPAPQIKSLQDLIEVVGCGERLSALAEEIRWEIYEAEAYHRPVRDLSNHFRYPCVTGRELLEAGFKPTVLGWLGLGSEPIAPPARYERIFAVPCGHWMVWGTVQSGYFVLREDPTVLYRA